MMALLTIFYIESELINIQWQSIIQLTSFVTLAVSVLKGQKSA